MADRIPSTVPGVVAVLLVAFVGAQFAPRAAAQDAEPCIASTIKGYNVAVQLGSLILHWMTPNSTTLNLLLETTVPGWAAVGWSADGKMVGSDAVVGNTGDPATVQAYTLNSVFLGGQTPTTSFELGKTSVTANGDSTYNRFSRAEGSGNVPVKFSGPSAIIYASSTDGSKTFGYHGPLRGTVVIDFACKVESASPPPSDSSPPPSGGTSSPPASPPTPAQPTPSSSPPPSPKAGGLTVDHHWLLPVALIAGLLPYLLGMV